MDQETIKRRLDWGRWAGVLVVRSDDAVFMLQAIEFAGYSLKSRHFHANCRNSFYTFLKARFRDPVYLALCGAKAEGRCERQATR